MDGKLECFDCSELLSVSFFYTAEKNKTGYQSCCKQCMSDRVLLDRMGITRAQYYEMLAAQGGVCAICKQDEIVRKRKSNNEVRYFAVDHDHACCPGRKSCGECLRGLLCYQCNVSLGGIERAGGVDPFAAYLGQYAKL